MENVFSPSGKAPQKILAIIVTIISANILANLLAVGLLNPLTPILFAQPVEGQGIGAAIALSTTAKVVVISAIYVIPFIIPTVLIMAYLAPLFRIVFGLKNTLKPSRIMNMPFVVSFLGVLGWIVPNISMLILEKYYPLIHTEWPKFISLNLLLGLFVFVFSYYILEWISQRFIIPLFFPQNRLSDISAALRFTIPSRFLIFLFAVSIFPAGMLTLAFSGTVSRIRDAGILIPVMPFYTLLGIVLALTIAVTLLLSRSFQKPLVEMRQAVEMIEKGDYTVSVAVASNDEMGRLGEGINTMSRGLLEKEFIKETFGRMVDPTIRDHLLSGNVQLGGENRFATVLFSDIRGFTALLETMDPHNAVELLNRYFEAMNRAIAKHNGIVNKYIGDAVMALFGVPLDDPDHADNAVRAALAMREARENLNRDLVKEGLPPLSAGIGIHSGHLLAGNIGSHQRMEYTVIGDTVNVASRLEGLCKEAKRDLLVSATTRNLLKMQYPMQAMDSYQVRGRQEAVEVFSLPPMDSTDFML